MTAATITHILGISDERTDCECCGRSNLKRTIVLSIRTANGDESVVYYGTDCARRTLGLSAKRAREAVEIAQLAAALAAVIAALRARPDARDVAVRTARGDAHEARQGLLTTYWSENHQGRLEIARGAYGALRRANELAARASAQ